MHHRLRKKTHQIHNRMRGFTLRAQISHRIRKTYIESERFAVDSAKSLKYTSYKVLFE